MGIALNQEAVNDAAKLVMHRLIARRLALDPRLVERARISHAGVSERFPGWAFVSEWDALLSLPSSQLRGLLTSRRPEMKRLRLSSPFVIAEGIDFTDRDLRRRIRHVAKRVVARGLASSRAVSTVAA